ncbi:hypothetical protein D3C72_1389680 [compost metagenome]
MVVAGDDRGDARLGVVLVVDGHAARGHHLQRLERVAFHDHVLRRPVRARHRVLVFIALVLGGLDRARLHADLDLGDDVGLGQPQVDQVQPRVAPDHVQVAARRRHARDMHRVAGLDDVDDLLAVAIDQRDLAGVAQRDREEVVQVVLVHLLGRPLRDGQDVLAAFLDVSQRKFRRCRRIELYITGHQVDFLVGEVAGCAPVRHAGRAAVLDEGLQVFRAARAGDVWRQRLAGRALAQHAVAAGAALEVDLPGVIELGRGQRGDRRLLFGLGFSLWCGLGGVGGCLGKSQPERERQCRECGVKPFSCFHGAVVQRVVESCCRGAVGRELAPGACSDDGDTLRVGD